MKIANPLIRKIQAERRRMAALTKMCETSGYTTAKMFWQGQTEALDKAIAVMQGRNLRKGEIV